MDHLECMRRTTYEQMFAAALAQTIWSTKGDEGEASEMDRLPRPTSESRPYPYQTRWAVGHDYPQLVQIPTGLGKTAGAVLSWLWRRRFADSSIQQRTPRRLVYCLPMRVLVEQTRDNAASWLNNLGMLAGTIEKITSVGKGTVAYRPDPSDDRPLDGFSQEVCCTGARIPVITLMGGEDEPDWDDYPERDQIIVGTQDMLLSRALNRGYTVSRYRWPMQLGLLNNDCLWILDEVQLMGAGLATSTQLAAFRDVIGTAVRTHSLWMSATSDPSWLRTADYDPSSKIVDRLEVGADDRGNANIARRMRAAKTLTKGTSNVHEPNAVAKEIVAHHRPGSLTLVVVNTVRRAREIQSSLDKLIKEEKTLLLHSQFRPADRIAVIRELLSPVGKVGRICVTTQVIEAGMDVSSRTLFSDLAPWSSMVQRFGRCNRGGEFDDSEIVWMDLSENGKDDYFLPYERERLEESREVLLGLEEKSVSPENLPHVPMNMARTQVIRRKDMIELFDTSSDLAGHDIDVSRFIRETDDRDVHVFWRDLGGEAPGSDVPGPGSEELCPAPIKEVRQLLQKGVKRMFSWDPLEGSWNEPRSDQLRPGVEIMLDSKSGCYSAARGWDPKTNGKVKEIAVAHDGRKDVGYGENEMAASAWATIAEHTEQVVHQVNRMADDIGLGEEFRTCLAGAACWHDVGKAHPAFQRKIAREKVPQERSGELWAKAPKDAWVSDSESIDHRRFLRHELASGLMAAQAGETNLVAYLAAAHHGKIRLSIRSLPNESRPTEGERRYARGIWDGDEIPEVGQVCGRTIGKAIIDLSCMEIGISEKGNRSWYSRMLELRDKPELGIFRLAFLESLIKAADERASGGMP